LGVDIIMHSWNPFGRTSGVASWARVSGNAWSHLLAGVCRGRTFHSTSFMTSRYRLAIPDVPPPPPSNFFASLLPPTSPLSPPSTSSITTQETTPFQHFLDDKDVKYLTDSLPSAVVEREGWLSPSQMKRMQVQLETTNRLISMKNANAKARMLWNIQHAVKTFAREEGDTGSPEVQVAVWTIRIRNLEHHLVTHRKDRHNRRSLRKLIHQRAKMLRYLRRQSVERYYQLLRRLELTPKMVEGEIVVP